MSELFKYYAYAFLGLRVLVDLALSGIIYYRTGSFANAFGLIPICGVFYLFLFFGIRNEEFHGRYGHRITVRESFAY